MLGSCGIPINFLSPGIEAMYEVNDQKVTLKLTPSDKFYIILIYDIISKKNSPKLEVKAKKLDSRKSKIKSYKLKSLNFSDTNQAMDMNSHSLLIGECVLVNKNQKQNHLISTQDKFSSKFDFMKTIGKGAHDHIHTFDELYVITHNNYWMTIPEFLMLNRISHDISLRKFINKPVEVFMLESSYYIKLIKQLTQIQLVLNESPDINEDKKKELTFNQAQLDQRIQMSQIEHLSHAKFSNWFISPPCFSNTLGAVIGLAIYEQLFRFKSDKNYIDYIEKQIKQKDTWRHFKDNQDPKDFKNYKKFLDFLTSSVGLVQKIGLSFIENTSNPNPLKQIQEISNTTGFTIHFHDFTEGLEEYKLMPLNDQLESKPLIKLGKFFDKYFILYSDDQMAADGYKGKTFKDIDPNLPKIYPFYNDLKLIDSKGIENFLESIREKLEKLINYVKDKTSGRKFDPNINLSLGNEVKSFEDSLNQNSIFIRSSVLQEFSVIPLNDIAYHISSGTSKKQFCCCDCGAYFDDNGNNCIRFKCKHAYEYNHFMKINQMYQNQLNYCIICYWMTQQQIPRIN
jgi:hypothetical protein